MFLLSHYQRHRVIRCLDSPAITQKMTKTTLNMSDTVVGQSTSSTQITISTLQPLLSLSMVAGFPVITGKLGTNFFAYQTHRKCNDNSCGFAQLVPSYSNLATPSAAPALRTSKLRPSKVLTSEATSVSGESLSMKLSTVRVGFVSVSPTSRHMLLLNKAPITTEPRPRLLPSQLSDQSIFRTLLENYNT